jgi:hypothetical protein
MGTSSGVKTQMLPGRECRWHLPTARLKSPDGLHLFLQRQLPHKANLPCTLPIAPCCRLSPLAREDVFPSASVAVYGPNCARLVSLAPRSSRRSAPIVSAPRQSALYAPIAPLRFFLRLKLPRNTLSSRSVKSLTGLNINLNLHQLQ